MRRQTISKCSRLILPIICIFLYGCQKSVVKLPDVEKATLSPKIIGYCNQGSQALDNNDLATAEKMFLIASQQPNAQDLPETASALEGLAFVKFKQGQLDQSTDLLKRAVAIYEEQPQGKFSLSLMRPLWVLSCIYNQQNKTQDEKTVLSQAVDVGMHDDANSSSREYIMCLLKLGAIYSKESQQLQAEALLRRAYDLQQHTRDQDGQLANIESALARVMQLERQS